MFSGFDDLNAVPLTYSGTRQASTCKLPGSLSANSKCCFTAGVVVAIAAFPGKSIGECIFGVMIALFGVGLGAANFAILSKLRVSLVAQAIVFVIMVYLLALMKAADPRYHRLVSYAPQKHLFSKCRLFAFSLLAILMTFNGV